MKKSIEKDTLINYGFYCGLCIKAISALAEFAGGLILSILTHNRLNQLIWMIAAPELREDPKDIVMNYLLKLGQSFSLTSQHSISVYMLLHGITKFVAIFLLWKKKIWAYPLATIVFGIFIIYEFYSYLSSHSILMLLIIFVDIIIVLMIILEYRHLKLEKSK